MLYLVAPAIAFFWAHTFLSESASLLLVASTAIVGVLSKMLLIGPGLADIYRWRLSRQNRTLAEGQTLSEAVISGPFVSVCASALFSLGVIALVHFEVISLRSAQVCVFILAANELAGYVSSFSIHQRRSLGGTVVALVGYAVTFVFLASAT